MPGTQGLPLDLLKQVEPFPTAELVPYDTAFLSGHVVEHYRVVLFDAAQRSVDQMNAALQQLCAQQIPGDTHRNLNVHADYSGQTFKHILVPVWLLNYAYGTRNFQVVINGYTGAIDGEYPKSWVKIFFAVLLLVIVAGVMLIIANK